jgi:hypothetical protein
MAKPKRLDYSEFMGRFGWPVYEADSGVMEPPSPVAVVPELRVIEEAARRNCPSAFSKFLQQWLRKLGIEPPRGVFCPIRDKRRGRKEDPKSFQVYLWWLHEGKPKLSSTKLAKSYFGTQAYNRAGLDGQKKMIDQLRRSVERYELRRANERALIQPPGFRSPD